MKNIILILAICFVLGCAKEPVTFIRNDLVSANVAIYGYNNEVVKNWKNVKNITVHVGYVCFFSENGGKVIVNGPYVIEYN